MRLLSSICIVFLLVVAQSQTPSANEALSRQLLEKSGAIEGMKTLPESVRLQTDTLSEQGLTVDPAFKTAWNEAAQRSFEMDKIVPAMATTMSELLTEQDLKTLVAYYDTPFAKRIVQLEIDGGKPEKLAEALAYAESLKADAGKYAARLKLYKQLDEAANLSTLATNLGINMAVAVQTGMMASGKMPIQLTYEEIKAAVEQQRPVLTQQVITVIYGLLAYIYRDVNEEDMRAYISFLESTPGKKFYASYGQAADLAVSVASREFGRRVAEGLGRRPI